MSWCTSLQIFLHVYFPSKNKDQLQTLGQPLSTGGMVQVTECLPNKLKALCCPQKTTNQTTTQYKTTEGKRK
jgi:hypothetical protein